MSSNKESHKQFSTAASFGGNIWLWIIKQWGGKLNPRCLWLDSTFSFSFFPFLPFFENKNEIPTRNENVKTRERDKIEDGKWPFIGFQNSKQAKNCTCEACLHRNRINIVCVNSNCYSRGKSNRSQLLYRWDTIRFSMCAHAYFNIFIHMYGYCAALSCDVLGFALLRCAMCLTFLCYAPHTRWAK